MYVYMLVTYSFFWFLRAGDVLLMLFMSSTSLMNPLVTSHSHEDIGSPVLSLGGASEGRTKNLHLQYL